jgi:hypothetical protein
MSSTHDGGCVCGATRFRTTGIPVLAQACHCKFCQRRTGSAFALTIVFKPDQFELTGAPLSEYEHRSDESNKWLRCHFCPRCGTTVFLTIERDPSLRIVSGGTFDETDWFTIERHTWTRSSPHWMVLPELAERYEKAYIRKK